ncbi:MAG: hypothetical protein EXS03_07830 [Phycisphaerales bacterium]|nr:hypothetical protein [Phycisphaerales bacterium]
MTRAYRAAVGTRVHLVAITLVTMALVAAPALGQDSPNAPRQPAVRNFPSAWVGYTAMFFVVSLVVAVSLYPSKRGHQE